ncbi:MAG TPA: complex I subunit 1 family protein, partial [Nitrososphaerales archaeon]|nr:complex I subunit 1 family protein [Nitrososphaerales archaeon]
MSKPITTFEDFVWRILTVVFYVVLLAVFILVPIYYLLDAVFHFPVDIFALATVKPFQFLTFQQNLLATEPFRTLFALTTFPGFTFVAVYSTILMGWVERKLTAKIQLRTGPMYAGKVEGILQNFADFFKLLFKEIVIPNGVDRATFIAIPFALMAVAGALVALVPLSPTTYIANPSVGAVLVFAILGFSPLIVLLAGWASNSKYPFLGGLRALHQLVAYEIPLVLSLVGAVILAGSLNLMDIVNAQGSVWYIVLQPLGAIVFFIGALAELERIPFDLPEADSELVAGWQTEYTSMLFGTFQLANFSRMYVMAGLFTTFFLGGWLGPSPVPPEVWFILKTTVVMVVMMLPRSIMPRVRIDILLRAGWVRL